MRKSLLSALVLACALLLAIPPAAADTVFTLPGAFGTQDSMLNQLGGEITDGHTVVPVDYGNYTLCTSCAGESAGPLLQEAITTTPGKKVVFGYSLGARASKYWIDTYGADSAVPAGELSFVLIGSDYGDGNGGDLSTQYPVTVVFRQYEPYADAPNNTDSPYYTLAWINSVMGNSLHGEYETVSLTDPNNVTTTVGNVTYVIVPTDTLPLFSWLEPFAPNLAADLDNQWRPRIDSAYIRPNNVTIPDPTPPPAEPVAQTVTQPQPESVAVVEESQPRTQAVVADSAPRRAKAKLRAESQTNASVEAETANAPVKSEPAETGTAADTTAPEPDAKPEPAAAEADAEPADTAT